MGSETKNADGYTFAELYAKEIKATPLEVKDNLNWTVHHPRSDAPKAFRRNKGAEWLVK